MYMPTANIYSVDIWLKGIDITQISSKAGSIAQSHTVILYFTGSQLGPTSTVSCARAFDAEKSSSYTRNVCQNSILL